MKISLFTLYTVSLFSAITITIIKQIRCQQEVVQVDVTLQEIYPREVQGVWTGEDQVVDQHGNIYYFCSISIKRPNKKFAHFSKPGKCDENRQLQMEDFLFGIDIQSSYIGRMYYIICDGLGKGRFVYLNNSMESMPYACGTYERVGEYYYSALGHFNDNPLAAVCPHSAQADPLISSDTWYRTILRAADQYSKNITTKDYTCQ